MPHTDGSAHLRLGWGTEAQVAVKLELEKEPEGRIEIYIEEHPHFEKLIHQWAMESVDLELLRVDDNLHWRVLIDCAVVSADGNILDCISCAIAAAIATTEVPRLSVVHSGESDFSLEVEDGFDRLNWDWPLTVCAAGFPQDSIALDPTREEELSASYTIAVVINSTGCIGIQCPLLSTGRTRATTHSHVSCAGTAVSDSLGAIAMDPGALTDIITQCVEVANVHQETFKAYIAKQ